MNWLKQLLVRRRIYGDLSEEIKEHLHEKTEELVAGGMPREEAVLAARREFGNVTLIQEDSYEVWWPSVERLFSRDVRYAWRIWLAHPLLTGAAVLSLALGMGANTAVFSVMNALLLKSAPVSDPRTLVALYSTSAVNPGWHQTSFKNYEDLRDRVQFGLAAYAAIPVGLSTAGGQPEQVPTEIVSGNYFELLGVQAALGRLFSFTAAEDKVADGHPDVVISDSLWKRRFGSRADVVDQTVLLNSRPFRIVGVAPPGFVGLDLMRAVDVWVPSLNQAVLTGVNRFYFQNRSIGMFDVVARTTPAIGLPKLHSLLQAEASRLGQTFPKDNKGLSFATRPFSHARMNPAQRETWVRAGGLLAVVVGLVLLIACANVANLLLARSASRRREVAVRLAIGASRRQLVQQLLVESLMLSSAGALAGLGVAWGALRLLSALRPAFVPASFQASIDWTTLLFTGAVAFVIGPMFGLVPALQASQVNVVDGLKSGDLTQRVARSDFSLALIVAQSTLATVALILAGLFVRSLQHAQEIQPGFDPDRVAIVSFDLGMLGYDNKKGPEFVRRVIERTRAVPGVVSSAVATHVLLDGAGLVSKIKLAGQEDAEALSVEAGAVGMDYFRTMGISLVAGRSFQESDGAEVSEFGWAVVNQTMAKRLWPRRDPLGQRFQVVGIKEPYVVVGVVTDAQYDTLGESGRPYFYIYYDQTPGLKKLTLHVQTASDPRLILGEIKREVQAADPNLPLINVRTMSEVMTQAMWVPRTGAALLVLFGAMALVLAAVGTYGVTRVFVALRRREIGIRVALGATPANILSRVMLRTFMPALAGVGLGLAAAYLGARLVGSLLFGVAPTDATSFGSAVVVLAVAAGAASLLPALSAMRLDPARLLRLD